MDTVADYKTYRSQIQCMFFDLLCHYQHDIRCQMILTSPMDGSVSYGRKVQQNKQQYKD